jgi:hypothetical protein
VHSRVFAQNTACLFVFEFITKLRAGGRRVHLWRMCMKRNNYRRLVSIWCAHTLTKAHSRFMVPLFVRACLSAIAPQTDGGPRIFGRETAPRVVSDSHAHPIPRIDSPTLIYTRGELERTSWHG